MENGFPDVPGHQDPRVRQTELATMITAHGARVPWGQRRIEVGEPPGCRGRCGRRAQRSAPNLPRWCGPPRWRFRLRSV